MKEKKGAIFYETPCRLRLDASSLLWFFAIFTKVCRVFSNHFCHDFLLSLFMTYSPYYLTSQCVCRVINSHNLTPVKQNDWNMSHVCVSHARHMTDTLSIGLEIQGSHCRHEIKFKNFSKNKNCWH